MFVSFPFQIWFQNCLLNWFKGSKVQKKNVTSNALSVRPDYFTLSSSSSSSSFSSSSSSSSSDTSFSILCSENFYSLGIII